MIPYFSFTENGRWRLALSGSDKELEILRTGKFDHRVVMKTKYPDWEPVGDDGVKTVMREHVSQIRDFAGDDGTPLAVANTYRVDNQGDVEDWEAQVRKRLEAISTEIAMLIPPTIPNIDDKDWLAHCLFVARTGTGKTNAIRWRINALLEIVRHGRCSVILMEPKGVVSDELLRLADLWEMRDRVVIIDPADCLVAVNPFDAGDRSTQAVNATIDRLNRIFALLTAGLSPFQTTVMQMAIRAMFASGRTPSMATLTDILTYGIEAPGLRGAVADFFSKRFRQGNRPDARADEVINRLYGMLANPTFEALFSGETTFDMLAEMQAGKLIVIKADAMTIGGNPELYARFWVEEVAKTIYPRLALPEHDRLPTYFIIDEAGSYVSHDSALIDILARAREAKIGMMLAMQDMTDIGETKLRNAVFTNTALKFAAHTTGEIHDLARAMATAPEFFRTLKRYEFAFFGLNMDTAVKVKFPLVEFDTMPQMTDEEYEEMRRQNRDKYGYRPPESESDPTPSTPPPTSPPSSSAAKRRRYDDE